MYLFQQSVLQKQLKSLEGERVDKAWEAFTTYFHNPAIQENIRQSKEEQYQEGFLRELFVKILGYTLNPEPNFNLTTEYKNVKDSKKADGAILQEGQPIAVIELKGTNTANLDKIESQAFGYKNNQPNAVYVVTSNFEKLRFYIDHAVDYEEFNLFQLTKERFVVLWLCLAQENLFKGLPKQTKDSSVLEEENITKKLYKDYSAFRRELFESIAQKNPDKDRVLLFKKTQKLLDRFLFIFFAEDRLLLPPNSISKIIEQWVQLRDELDAYSPLYQRFQKYFGYLNTGYQGKQYDVFAYNGGLFLPDEVLDTITIDDDLLYKHTLNLSRYDFQTEIDVNILGHIFEHSLNELEEITAQLEGQEIDKSKTKRKKDGVFYTPKYITKYIVENTVGKLCEEKRAELQLIEEDYTSDKRRTKKKKKELLDKLESYREWLLQITICDPACGSGAFLNQALEFLIAEHGRLDELQTKLLGGSIVFPDVENSILENNLFGVDINEESVEIAKLSLWLRTAQKGRKLTSLSNNIKCGNSLIDDPEVAGEKAFVWESEFPQVFEKGGFDVVVGNPPYVRVQNLKSKDIDFFFENYKSPIGKLDISLLFIEKSFNSLLNKSGICSFITSSQWMQTEYGVKIRALIKSKKSLKEIIDFGTLPVFQDASTYPAIYTFKQNSSKILYKKITEKSKLNYESIIQAKSVEVDYSKISEKAWTFQKFDLLNHLNKKKIEWKELSEYGKAYYGIVTGMDKAFIVDDLIIDRNQLEKKLIIPYAFKGEEVNRYKNTIPSQKVIYPYKKNDDGSSQLLSEDELKKEFINIYSYLLQFKNELEQRKDSRKLYATGENWFRHVRQGNFNLISANKIQIRGIGKRVLGGLLKPNNAFSGANCPAIILDDAKELSSYLCLSIYNSKLITYHLNQVCPRKLGGYIRYNTKNLSKTPILIPNNVQEYEIKVKLILEEGDKLMERIEKFSRSVSRRFTIEKLSKKLQSWHLLTFAEFVKELKKKKIKLSLSEEAEWEDYFEQEKAKALAIQAEIDKTDKEIDRMVYELYELTEEEIAIVENSETNKQ